MDSHENPQVLFVFVLFVSLLFFFALSLYIYIGIPHENRDLCRGYRITLRR